MERALDQPNLKVWPDIQELYDLSARGPCAQLKKFNNNCTCMSKFLTLSWSFSAVSKYIIIDRAIWYIVDSAVCAIVHIL
jgi:hypothetical protein